MAGMTLETYFIRHGSNWRIDTGTRGMLLNDKLIAIHYEPIRSCNGSDYTHGGADVINRFRALSETGGLVLATYPPVPGCIIGEVKPGSEVLYHECVATDGSQVILKMIRLYEPKVFGVHVSGRLLVLSPRQLTFSKWPAVRNKVARLYSSGTLGIKYVSDLLPFELEVVCAEFLRAEILERKQLPLVSQFLFPVGRTLRDVDIVGITAEGRTVYAQVTYSEAAKAGTKIKALKQYAGDKVDLIMFCRCNAIATIENVTYFPIEMAVESIFRRFPQFFAAMNGK